MPSFSLNRQPIKKLSWWHESIVDWMLLNPEGKLGQCARDLGVTASWLSTIVNSQLFRELLAKRRLEHASNISTSVIDKTQGITHLALELVEERLSRDDVMPLSYKEIRETAELGLKAMGYTARSGGAVVINNPSGAVQVNTVTPEMLENARKKMQAQQAPLPPQPERKELSFDNEPEALMPAT